MIVIQTHYLLFIGVHKETCDVILYFQLIGPTDVAV